MSLGGLQNTGTDRGVGQNGRDPSFDISQDDLFDALANRRRRHALHMLRQRDEPLELGEVAEQVAAWENDTAVRDVSSTERKLVYTALQQNHLPKMDDVGLVDFDERRGIVEPTGAADSVDLYLEVVDEREIPWPAYYLGLGAASVALTAAVWLGAFPFALLPDVAWMAFVAAALVFSAAVHYYDTRGMRLGEGDVPPEVAHGTDPR